MNPNLKKMIAVVCAVSNFSIAVKAADAPVASAVAADGLDLQQLEAKAKKLKNREKIEELHSKIAEKKSQIAKKIVKMGLVENFSNDSMETRFLTQSEPLIKLEIASASTVVVVSASSLLGKLLKFKAVPLLAKVVVQGIEVAVISMVTYSEIISAKKDYIRYLEELLKDRGSAGINAEYQELQLDIEVFSRQIESLEAELKSLQ